MPRQAGVVVENSFKNGFVTEASGLNFPENAVTEAFNCEFQFDGSVKRRLGFDFESNYTTKAINRTNNVVNTYLWRNVAGKGEVSLLVVQVGATLYFYRTAGDNFSSGAVSTAIALTPVSGAPTPETVEAQFSDGNGFLFVTHPYCEPMRVAYDTTTDTASFANIFLRVRDFEGAAGDTFNVDERPTSTFAALNEHHKYNLFNQGWTTANLTAWDTAQTTMPSNADVMWRFKNATDDLDFTTASIARITAGNTPAPKGHFILILANQDRNAAAGTTGVTATTTSFQRPSTTAFFAGRVFYAGINHVGFNSKIYFSQIVEHNDQYGHCYQTNDPTSEDLFDLLPSDGGVISIPEAGTIYKLVTVPGGIAVFAANGIWFITGSTGIGFIANDYTVQKVSDVQTLSAASFVSVAGFPSWWNSEGIYVMNAQGNLPTVQSITDPRIKTFYDTIPMESKRFARGMYHYIDGHIRWIFRSETTDQVTNIYEFDRVLNFNTRSGAFYLWSVTDSDVKINAILISDVVSGAIGAHQVVTAAVDNVIDSDTNNVIVFTAAGSEDSPFDKYLVSYADEVTYNFTFADKIDSAYRDWFTYDFAGVDFTSYFITGYKVRGEGIRKFQSNWVEVFTQISEIAAYYFQGIWDFATTGSGTGRWSVRQHVNRNEPKYSTVSNRLKVRGHGKALQFKVTSVPGYPFDIIGWSSLQSVNQIP